MLLKFLGPGLCAILLGAGCCLSAGTDAGEADAASDADAGADGGDADTDNDAGTDVDTDTDSECPWDEVFPLDGAGVGAPFSALVRRTDGSLAAVSQLGEVVLGSGTEFSLVPEAAPGFVALDAAEDADGALLLGGFEGELGTYTDLPIPGGFTGPPALIRFGGTTFESVDLGDPVCDAIIGIWTGGEGAALALCENGNLLERGGSGWSPIAETPPWYVADPGSADDEWIDFLGLWGDGPSNIMVFGVVPPLMGLEATTGFIFHFDGGEWHEVENPYSSFGGDWTAAVWGTSRNDATALTADVAVYSSDFVVTHYDGTQWVNVVTFGVNMYAAPTRPLVLGDDVYVATRFGVYHGSPAGWSLLTLSPSGEPRHIAQGGDADLFVTTDDGKIYRRVCP